MSLTAVREQVRPGEDVTGLLQVMDPAVVDLAATLSLAVRVEPALIRAIRVSLHPKLSVAAEADLWFSPLVESKNRTGFTLLPLVREGLQQRLANDPRLDQVWAIVQGAHRNAPKLMQIEEELTWLALRDSSDARIVERLGQLIATMISDPARGRGLARWAARAVPRLPERIRHLDEAWMLAIGASIRLGGRRLLMDRPPPEVLPGWLPSLIPSDAPQIQVGVRFRRGLLELSEPPLDLSTVIEVPGTNPLVVEILREETEESGVQVVFDQAMTVTVEVDFGDVYLRTAVGDLYRLRVGEVRDLAGPAQRMADFRDERQRTRISPITAQPESRFARDMVDIALKGLRHELFAACDSMSWTSRRASSTSSEDPGPYASKSRRAA